MIHPIGEMRGQTEIEIDLLDGTLLLVDIAVLVAVEMSVDAVVRRILIAKRRSPVMKSELMVCGVQEYLL